ncbi:flagellar export chaperone FlgN [Isoptericola sp. b441]|uniref:Flagellar export chaperone FlgN n=1 Tax=Actinotalea lenta TaxID=3064654 RepID=A0ABT9D5Q6_9CELL|nr:MULTISPECIES: flagellar export chaperone FlgN [unclassified Isoptericola]MDO8106132.1 flagellar export chaperone FlgN [Isoptericola sp. b441]MDO8122149.1 flagellar export chaperone FlgN [Isoptericola sp. b490]
MGLNELSGVLWRERQLLELLLFKLEEEQLILTSGRTQWLGHATREVESVLEQIRTAELGRSMEADEAALEVGVPVGSGLRAIAGAAPAPWDTLLAEHHAAFVSLTDQINELAQGNRELLAASHRATRETLMSLQETVDTYDPRGGAATAVAGTSHLLDQAL